MKFIFYIAFMCDTFQNIYIINGAATAPNESNKCFSVAATAPFERKDLMAFPLCLYKKFLLVKAKVNFANLQFLLLKNSCFSLILIGLRDYEPITYFCIRSISFFTRFFFYTACSGTNLPCKNRFRCNKIVGHYEPEF